MDLEITKDYMLYHPTAYPNLDIREHRNLFSKVFNKHTLEPVFLDIWKNMCSWSEQFEYKAGDNNYFTITLENSFDDTYSNVYIYDPDKIYSVKFKKERIDKYKIVNNTVHRETINAIGMPMFGGKILDFNYNLLKKITNGNINLLNDDLPLSVDFDIMIEDVNLYYDNNKIMLADILMLFRYESTEELDLHVKHNYSFKTNRDLKTHILVDKKMNKEIGKSIFVNCDEYDGGWFGLIENETFNREYLKYMINHLKKYFNDNRIQINSIITNITEQTKVSDFELNIKDYDENIFQLYPTVTEKIPESINEFSWGNKKHINRIFSIEISVDHNQNKFTDHFLEFFCRKTKSSNTYSSCNTENTRIIMVEDGNIQYYFHRYYYLHQLTRLQTRLVNINSENRKKLFCKRYNHILENSKNIKEYANQLPSGNNDLKHFLQLFYNCLENPDIDSLISSDFLSVEMPKSLKTIKDYVTNSCYVEEEKQQILEHIEKIKQIKVNIDDFYFTDVLKYLRSFFDIIDKIKSNRDLIVEKINKKYEDDNELSDLLSTFSEINKKNEELFTKIIYLEIQKMTNLFNSIKYNKKENVGLKYYNIHCGRYLKNTKKSLPKKSRSSLKRTKSAKY